MISLLNNLTVTIGRNMRRYREQCGRTQKEVAKLLNIDAQYYGEAERGRKRLSLECLTELCSFYRIPLDCLIPVPIREDESDREKALAELEAVLDGCTADQLRLLRLLARDVRDFTGAAPSGAQGE